MPPAKKATVKAAAKPAAKKSAVKVKETKPKVVRAAVVGISMGGHHAATLAKNAKAELVALCDLNTERANKMAAELGAKIVTDDWKQVVANKDIDAVVVALPNYLHHPVVMAALKAGKHVCCEKPLAMTPAEADEMVATAKKAGKLLMVAVNNRYRDDIQVLKRMIDAGELGKIYFAKAGWMRRHGCPAGWFGMKKQSGGGPLIDLGVHYLDLAWYLLGCPKPVSAFGSTYAEIGRRGQKGGWGVGAKDAPFDVEDLAIGMLKFEGGQTLLVEVSWATYVKGDYSWLEVMGNQGGASFQDGLKIFKDMHGTEVDWSPKYDTRMSSHAAEIDHFVDCILTGKPLISPGEQGAQMIHMLAGIYESAETGKLVKL